MSNKSAPKTKSNPRTGSWSKKIIASRTKNKKWHKAMLQGRIEAKANPSNIQILRNQRQWRQADLATMLNIKTPTLTAIERGRRPVKKEVASRIAAKLGVPMSKLFTQQGKKFVAVIQKPTI